MGLSLTFYCEKSTVIIVWGGWHRGDKSGEGQDGDLQSRRHFYSGGNWLNERVVGVEEARQ